MSAVSGGVGLGAGVGRGRGVGTGPPFEGTAPMANMRTANAALINFVIVFICFSSLFSGICRPKFWNFFRNRRNFWSGARLLGGSRSAQFNKPSCPSKHKGMPPAEVGGRTSFVLEQSSRPRLTGCAYGFSAKADYPALSLCHWCFAGEVFAQLGCRLPWIIDIILTGSCLTSYQWIESEESFERRGLSSQHQ